MAWISDDYICKNPKCNKYKQVVEKLGKREERDTYICNGYILPSEADVPKEFKTPHARTTAYRTPCGKLLVRLISAPRTTHVSWSTWRI